MSQKLINLNVNADRVAAIGKSMGELEIQFVDLIALSNDQRRAARKMGPRSEQFCRQTITVLGLNPAVVPSTIGVDVAQANLDTLDQLRPLFQRLYRLSARAADSELALGADAMASALAGYRVLKAVGKAEGLEAVRKELGASVFTGKRGPAVPVEPATT